MRGITRWTYHNTSEPGCLDLARLIAANDLIEVLVPGDTGRRGMRAVGHPVLGGLLSPQADDAELLSLYALAELVREGAKVVRPSPELCRVLRHVDLDLGVRDYAQPFPSMASLIPGGVLGLERDALAVALWLPDRGLHVVGFLDGGEALIWSTTDIHHPEPLEVSLRFHEEGPRDVATALDRRGRGPLLGDVPDRAEPRAARHREGGAGRARSTPRRSGAGVVRRATSGWRGWRRRDAREVVIRDVDLIVRASRGACRSTGQGAWHQPAHIRRGHWRMQPVGPGRARTRRIWVSPYWVGLGEGATPPSHITTVLS